MRESSIPPITRYGIRHKPTGNLMEIDVYVIYFEDYAQKQFVLEEYAYGNALWLVTRKEVAEKAIKEHVIEENAGYETPYHRFKPEDLEVVEVNIDVMQWGIEITPDLQVDIEDVISHQMCKEISEKLGRDYK